MFWEVLGEERKRQTAKSNEKKKKKQEAKEDEESADARKMKRNRLMADCQLIYLFTVSLDLGFDDAS